MMHMWAEMRVMAVEIEVSKTIPGNLDIHVSESQEQFANEDAIVACWVCAAIPTVNNLKEDCPGNAG